MLLFKGRFHPGLVDGSITLTFRAWPKSRVKAGGRYRCHPIGVIAVDSVERVTIDTISSDDARRAGFPSRAELLDYLREYGGALSGNDEVWRVEIHYAGDGDRTSVAMDEELSEPELAGLRKKLDRMDVTSKTGPWTMKTLQLIAQHPRVVASKLAVMLGREKPAFKADVVKLKKLGLTQSFEIGYEITPRGRELLLRIAGNAE